MQSHLLKCVDRHMKARMSCVYVTSVAVYRTLEHIRNQSEKNICAD